MQRSAQPIDISVSTATNIIQIIPKGSFGFILLFLQFTNEFCFDLLYNCNVIDAVQFLLVATFGYSGNFVGRESKEKKLLEEEREGGGAGFT